MHRATPGPAIPYPTEEIGLDTTPENEAEAALADAGLGIALIVVVIGLEMLQ